jgi:hypothetical protein
MAFLAIPTSRDVIFVIEWVKLWTSFFTGFAFFFKSLREVLLTKLNYFLCFYRGHGVLGKNRPKHLEYLGLTQKKGQSTEKERINFGKGFRATN